MQMSLITRCPACGTMFKVVPDQLRISEGWVRCGQCSELFDAGVHMQTLGVRPEAVQAFSNELPHEKTTHASTAADRAAEAFFALDLGGERPVVDPVERQSYELELPDSSLDAPVSSGPMLVSPAVLPESIQDEVGVPQAKPQTGPELTDGSAASAPYPEDNLSFVQDARRKAYWSRPKVRLLMVLLVLLLALALALQLAYHERDRLAAIEPQLKPWLERLCVPFGCTISAPRLIESVVIESSAFSKLRTDVFRLSFTIRNSSGIEVATPAVEVTLTDTQDQVVVRRVLLPPELGAAVVLPPRGEWSAAISLSMDGQGEGARVAGYRLVAFYP
jgi:predicted Zn finger-like uncharacterized protein